MATEGLSNAVERLFDESFTRPSRVPGWRDKQFSVLIVDDDDRILNYLRVKLKSAGYGVLTAGNGVEALAQIHVQEPNLILLNVLLPKMDGFETLKELRSFSGAAVIMLSANGTAVDRIKGLTLGADDYLQKPFNPDELLARIEAVRRRLEPPERRATAKPLKIGSLTVDFKERRVVLNGKEEYLTRIEWLLLSELAHNAGCLMTHDELLTRIWGPEYRDDLKILRTWISRLRYKLGDDLNNARLIRTIPKTGYIMEQAATAPLAAR